MATIIPTAPKRRPRKRLFIIVAIVVVLVGAGVGFAFTPVGSQFYKTVGDKVAELFGKTPEPAEENTDDIPASATNTNETYASASKLIEEGKSNEGEAVYQEKIDATESTPDKATYYLELAGALMAHGASRDVSKALSYAQQAEKLNPTPQSAAQLAEIYEAQGNTAQAEKYQNLVRERDTSEWKDR